MSINAIATANPPSNGITYSVSGNAANFLGITAGGVITGTPTTADTYYLTITATDSTTNQSISSTALAINVSAPPSWNDGNKPPTASAS